jgi:metal-sulfur cluster biosynthetic enzyme
MSASRSAVLRVVATVVLVGAGVVVMNLPALVGRGRAPGAGLVHRDSAGPQPGAEPPESTEVVRALGNVTDPEINMSIVDLGLLDSLAVDSAGNVRVVLALTTPACPFAAGIGRRALAELRRLPGARLVEVRLDPNAGWDPSRLTDNGRRRYRERFGGAADSGR